MEKSRVIPNARFDRRTFCCGILASLAVPYSCFGKSGGVNAKPFVKWAGGKGQLLEQLFALLPKDLSERKHLVYAEPFVGGGAMLFFMLSRFQNIESAVVADVNRDLITAYRTVRNQPNELISALEEMQNEFYGKATEDARKEYFLEKREQYNHHDNGDVETAALFIFLNRTCFNGLYRVNAKGLYNVPFGKATRPLICDADAIRADSALLQKVEILNCDFEGVEKRVGGRAFYYFDPPYRPLTTTAGFTAYSKDGFGDDQQRRLAAFCRRLDASGCQWLLSNSDPHNADPRDMFFEELFKGFDINRVSANRMINSKSDGRGKITELAIRNYKEK
ncbi:MAG: DNA adenine methylase [Kiritimatiellia bacterium]